MTTEYFSTSRLFIFPTKPLYYLGFKNQSEIRVMDDKDTVDGSELSSPDDADRFMLSDHRLLTSGFFADCEMVLGSKTWKLHKSVICLRSKYFERAFMGHWPEAKSGNITLSTDQFTEEHIEWLISFVYTGVCELEELKSKTTVLHTAAQLFALGDYFLVPGLCDCAIEAVTCQWDPRFRQSVARKRPWLRIHGPLRSWVYPFDGDDWERAMACVYKQWADSDENEFKKAMMRLSTDKLNCRHTLIRSPHFLSFIDKEPRFARDFMKVMVQDRVSKLQY